MIIFLFGEDEFRSLEKLNEIKNKFLEKNSSGQSPSYFDFEENKKIDLLQIKSGFKSEGLFGNKRLVIIRNLLACSLKNFISEFLVFLKSKKNISESKDLVVVFWEKGKINEKNELFKFLMKASKSQKFDILSEAKLEQWIISEFLKENEKVKVSQEAVKKIAAYTGGDLRLIKNEVKKLANYKNQGNVSGDDVEILVKEKISSSIFEAIDAISGGNKKLALELLYKQLKQGGDPVYILMMYIYQFRNFLKISEYYEKGERNSYEIAKKAGLHPFVAKKILGQINRFPLDKLKRIYGKLQAIDQKVKTGQGEIKMELDKFIVEI